MSGSYTHLSCSWLCVIAWYLMPVYIAVPFGVDVRLDVLERQVEADVAIEVAVVAVARVAFLGAPHLLATISMSRPKAATPLGQ